MKMKNTLKRPLYLLIADAHLDSTPMYCITGQVYTHILGSDAFQDPAIIGLSTAVVSDITNGCFNLLKWDKRERKYYPLRIDLHSKGERYERR